MIFKVQRPLNSGAEDIWLIYNKDNSIDFQSPPTQAMREHMGADVKMFVEAVYVATTLPAPTFKITKRIEDQDW